MKNRYSIAIYPSTDVMDQVKDCKDLLTKAIGWFHSRHSNAHITLIEFEANREELFIIRAFLKDFCATKSPFHISLDGVKNYLNGALFIAPDKESKITTKGFMQKLQKDFPLKSIFASRDPHMSIARQLDKQNIQIASYLLQDVKAEFDCNSIVLRQFSETIQQFNVIEEYFLNGKEDFPYKGGQLSLGL